MRQVPIGNTPGGIAEVRVLDQGMATVAVVHCDNRSSVNLADRAAINSHVRSCMDCLQIVAEYLFIDLVKREAKLKHGEPDEFVISELNLDESLEVIALQMYQAANAPHLSTEWCNNPEEE